MWLKSLHVENFRGFEQLDVTFDEHVTLLVGGNGAGKTAALDAIRAGLSSFWASLVDRFPFQIPDPDVRHVFREINGIPDAQLQWPVVIRLAALANHVPGEPDLRLQAELARLPSGATRPSSGGETSNYLTTLKSQLTSGRPVSLPLLAHYGIERSRLASTASGQPKQRPASRTDGYADSLAASASETGLVTWMQKRTAEEVQQQQSDRTFRHPQLAAVAAAVEACVDGATGLIFNLKRDEIDLRLGHRLLAFSMLSAGYRRLIAMVADVARRAAILNPQHGEEAPRETPGIVLIDEIELHLHPKWQRTVIPSLRRAFPKMQFIATTHSPQVLASVSRGQVRLFEDNRLVDAAFHVEGRSSNELLEDVFGVPARPPATKAELDDLFRLIDDGAFDDARRKLTALEARLGRDDGDIVRARWILESEAGVTPAPPIAS